jgi:hypothetical protein
MRSKRIAITAADPNMNIDYSPQRNSKRKLPLKSFFTNSSTTPDAFFIFNAVTTSYPRQLHQMDDGSQKPRTNTSVRDNFETRLRHLVCIGKEILNHTILCLCGSRPSENNLTPHLTSRNIHANIVPSHLFMVRKCHGVKKFSSRINLRNSDGQPVVYVIPRYLCYRPWPWVKVSILKIYKIRSWRVRLWIGDD